MVKLWNINENEDTTGKREVSLVTSRDLGVVRLTSYFFLSPFGPVTDASPVTSYRERSSPSTSRPTPPSPSPLPDPRPSSRSGTSRPTLVPERRSASG